MHLSPTFLGKGNSKCHLAWRFMPPSSLSQREAEIIKKGGKDTENPLFGNAEEKIWPIKTPMESMCEEQLLPQTTKQNSTKSQALVSKKFSSWIPWLLLFSNPHTQFFRQQSRHEWLVIMFLIAIQNIRENQTIFRAWFSTPNIIVEHLGPLQKTHVYKS